MANSGLMPSYTFLNDDIVCIDTEQLRPGLAASYLIGSNGRHAFVETGTSLSVPLLLATLDALGVARSAVDYVMPTHVHLDHAGGAGALMQALPQARLVIHPRGARHMIDPSRLIAGATAVYGEDFMRKTYGRIVPVPEERVLVAEVEPERDFALQLGQRRLELIDVQGHARHHYAIWDAQSCGWFSGDTFGSSYRELDQDGRAYIMPTTTPVQFDPPAWERSLGRILAREPRYIYLTHFSRIDDVALLGQELQQALDAYVRMARGVAAGPDRQELLAARLMAFHLDQLQARGHRLSVARLREFITPDVQINAQGLAFWLEHAA